MTDEQMKETMAAFQKDMMEKQAAAKKEAGAKNAAEGKKFLAENKTKEGVKTTAERPAIQSDEGRHRARLRRRPTR